MHVSIIIIVYGIVRSGNKYNITLDFKLNVKASLYLR